MSLKNGTDAGTPQLATKCMKAHHIGSLWSHPAAAFLLLRDLGQVHASLWCITQAVPAFQTQLNANSSSSRLLEWYLM